MNNEVIQLKRAVRQIMKNRGMTYGDLATHLGVSYATVKRIMTTEELSLSRLLDICDWLGVSIRDVATYASEHPEEPPGEFTIEQDLFLAADPRYYLFLAELVDGLTPARIQKKYNLTAKSLDKYLRKLEQLDLLKVAAGGKVRPTSRHMPSWRKNGEMTKLHFQRIIDGFSQFFKDFFFKKLNTDQAQAIKGRATTSLTKLSAKSFERYITELDAFTRKWGDIADLEQKTLPEHELKDLVIAKFVALSDQNPEVRKLEQVFGVVENLP